MMFFKKKEKEGFLKGVFMAYFILLFHVFLFACLGFLVLFFRGVMHYMIWIFAACSAAIIASGYLFYKRMIVEGKNIRDLINTPLFNNRSVEVSFLGGMAAVKIGNGGVALPAPPPAPVLQLEDPSAARLRNLKALAELYEKGLITEDEYHQAKSEMFHAQPAEINITKGES